MGTRGIKMYVEESLTQRSVCQNPGFQNEAKHRDAGCLITSLPLAKQSYSVSLEHARCDFWYSKWAHGAMFGLKKPLHLPSTSCSVLRLASCVDLYICSSHIHFMPIMWIPSHWIARVVQYSTCCSGGEETQLQALRHP